MGLRADIVLAGDLTPDERAHWMSWRKARPELKSPFFHIEFTQAVAAVGQSVFVAKLYDDEKLIGFFPFQRRGGTVYPVGAPMNDYHGVISPSEKSFSLEDLVSVLPVKRLSVNSWVDAAQEEPVSHLVLTTCQALVGDEGYEAWFESRRSQYNKYFKDKARSRRSMEAEVGPMRVETRLRDHALLDQLLALKSNQYKRTGRHDIFGDKWTARLLHRLLDIEGDFGATVATLYAGDSLLAIELSLHADGIWHFWFPAYLEKGAKYSPGIWLSLETIRQETARGVLEFDYGFSGEAYKKYFCNGSKSVVEANVGTGGISSFVDRMVGEGDLALSIRRRWATIDASEEQWCGRVLGTLFAGKGLIARLGRGESRK